MPAQVDPSTGAAMTEDWKSLIAQFVAWAAIRRSPYTAKIYEYSLRHWQRYADAHGVSDPEEVTCLDVEAFMDGELQSGRSEKTCNHRLAALRSFWHWMRRTGKATNDPGRDAVKFKEKQRLPDWLSIADQERLLSVTAERKGRARRPSREQFNGTRNRDQAIVALGLFTGLRVAEMVRLRLEDVDLTRGVLRVVDGKGGKSREVPVIDRLKPILTRWLRSRAFFLHGVESNWFFVSCHAMKDKSAWWCAPRAVGEQLGTKALYRVIRDLGKTILDRPISPHTLRHSFASRLREAGADLQLIQESLGHSDISTTTIYAKIVTSKRRQLLQDFLEQPAPETTGGPGHA